VADLAGDRHRTGEPGKERAQQRAEAEHLHLVRGAVDLLGGKGERVEQNGQEHEHEHGQEEPEVRGGRALLEQLGAKLCDHAPAPAVTSR
jgi:hypothetical protein